MGLSIAFVSSEVAPFAKTGGLADVSGALPKYLGERGHDVRVFMPFYSTVDVSKGDFRFVDYLRDVPIRFGGETITFNVVVTKLPGSHVDLYMIDAPRLYGRGKIYTDDRDEYLRYAFLSRAAIECCQRMGWSPEIFHCHDWQTGLIPLYLKTVYNWDRLFDRTRTILTIHNIAYQGVFSSEIIDHIGLEPHRRLLDQDDLSAGIVSYMKTGIVYADIITTVSETYAREIQTPEYGSGLERLLRLRSGSLIGIVNGVDYNEWSPEKDHLIPRNYSIDDLSGKEVCKQNLMSRMDLSYDPSHPLLGIVSRLTSQKGFELLVDILVPLLESYPIRVAILGSGEPKLERFFSEVMARYRDRVCFYRGFQNQLAHMIEAGADIFLMPSRYEPCGLNQIYSLRYGTIPVVRKTGGLADTVRNFDPNTREATGFVFEHFTPAGLAWASESAIKTYYHRDSWRKLMRSAMSEDFSWEKQVGRYESLYHALRG